MRRGEVVVIKECSGYVIYYNEELALKVKVKCCWCKNFVTKKVRYVGEKKAYLAR